MTENYERDLDLNLLRVFAVVADTGSVTRAAAQLYLTQPAVSAALRRLQRAVGAPLTMRRGRGIALTARGEALLQRIRPHLQPLVEAAMSPEPFDPARSRRLLRLGLSDSAEGWLLPPLLRALASEAPALQLVVLPVQFRTVAAALATGSVSLALTVADELPPAVARESLFTEGFVCLHDPRYAQLGARLTRARYLAHEHVIVSYNGDLRGIIEDMFGATRRVRCSVASFAHVGALIEGSALLATVPSRVGRYLQSLHPKLATAPVPFPIAGAPLELLWPRAADDDPALGYLRRLIVRVASDPPQAAPRRRGGAPRRGASGARRRT
jgi:LysR family transcriptional activator of mexEF-oprN operon